PRPDRERRRGRLARAVRPEAGGLHDRRRTELDRALVPPRRAPRCRRRDRALHRGPGGRHPRRASSSNARGPGGKRVARPQRPREPAMNDVAAGAGTASRALLEVDAITLAFGGVRALSGVGFDVAPGSITSVIGPNGAGKTSLFNTVSGFYRPASGSIRFEGRDITRMPAPKRAALGLARSFQNIALFRGMTVLDNIKLGRHCHLRTNVLDALVYFG